MKCKNCGKLKRDHFNTSKRDNSWCFLEEGISPSDDRYFMKYEEETANAEKVNNTQQEKHDRSVGIKGSPIAKAEAPNAKIAGDGGSPVVNPQDDPGKASGADNGDTDDSIFPADSYTKEKTSEDRK